MYQRRYDNPDNKPQGGRRPSTAVRSRNQSRYDTAEILQANDDADIFKMSAKPPKKPKKKHNIPRIVINIVASLVIVFSALYITAYALKDQRFFKNNQEEANHLYPEIVGSSDKDVEYYLVCGLDESKELTDVIMMVCWDKKDNKANIMQIPRDTFTTFDYSTGKINAVYGNPREGESSEKALCRVINNYFGLPVDHYIYISLSAFRDIVEALGGVEVDVPCDMDYRGVYVKKGTQVLDGAHAEVFMRNRKTYAMGDYGRVEAQRKFYAGLAEKLIDMNAVQMIEIFNSVKSELITDMSVGEIKRALNDVKKVNMKKINIFAVPGEAYDDYSKGYWNSLYTVHKQELVDKMNKYMNPYGAQINPDKILIEELANTGQESMDQGDSLGQYKESTAEPTSASETGTTAATE